MGMSMLLPEARTRSTPLCRMPGTVSRGRRCFMWAKAGTMSMCMGQAWAQRPQPVQTQGNLDSITSSTRPRLSMRMTLRVFQPSMPAMSLMGQPLTQAPQAKQADRSYLPKRSLISAGSSRGVTTFMARPLPPGRGYRPGGRVWV